MTEEVRVTGRPMTGQLQRALDSLGARDRAMVSPAFQTQQGRTGPLLRALALELQLCSLREDAAIAAAEGALAASDEDDRPYPPSPTPGLALWFDPANHRATVEDDTEEQIPSVTTCRASSGSFTATRAPRTPAAAGRPTH